MGVGRGGGEEDMAVSWFGWISNFLQPWCDLGVPRSLIWLNAVTYKALAELVMKEIAKSFQ